MSGSDDVGRTVKARTGGLFMAAVFLVVLLSLPVGASARDRAGTAGSTQAGLLASGSPDASCPRGAKPAIIAGTFKCLRVGSACKARYQAAYRKYGFRCVSGRLRKLTTPAPPPPPPPGQPGHYKGTTSQNESFEFDVTSNGRGVTNVVTGQINEGCNGGYTLFGFAGKWVTDILPLDASGGFSVDFPYITTVNSSAATGKFTLTGHLNGAVGVGNFQKTTSFTENGVAYACGSGLQTWTVTKIS